ncbi:MAG: hypothetical protein ACJ748_08625 [Flavisolibacter sp.]
MKKRIWISALCSMMLLINACKKSNEQAEVPKAKDPDTAPVVYVDRFSSAAGHLQVRSGTNGLPQPNQPIDLDKDPFITKGFGPNGEITQYYNLDVQSSTPAPIYVLFKQGANSPVEGQLNIINVLPGEEGYTDFWQIQKVSVPSDYVANTITSYDELKAKGYMIIPTMDLVNCPVVPKGSIASKTYGSSNPQSLARGWYKNQVVYYFSFTEKALTTTSDGKVPTIPIYVTFNINPDVSGGGPASGFKTEADGVQTHNVLSALPSMVGYSPLWIIDIYDNAYFNSVSNWSTASMAMLKAQGAALVNCPVVK